MIGIKKLIIGGVSALALGLVVFIYGLSQQGKSMATREVTEAFGGLSVDAQIALMNVATFGGLILLIAGIALTIVAFKKKKSFSKIFTKHKTSMASQMVAMDSCMKEGEFQNEKKHNAYVGFGIDVLTRRLFRRNA